MYSVDLLDACSCDGLAETSAIACRSLWPRASGGPAKCRTGASIHRDSPAYRWTRRANVTNFPPLAIQPGRFKRGGEGALRGTARPGIRVE